MFDKEGLSRLELLNSDYINEHYRDLQDTAYKRGVNDGSLDVKKRVGGAYQKGLNDAWEAARKIAGMWTRIDDDKLLAIFGITERIGHSTIRAMFEKQTANEAMLELEAYEEKQKADDEIKVGDEVQHGDSTGIVCAVGDLILSGLWTGDESFGPFQWYKEECKKTGRHFDIDKILEEMRCGQ